MALPPQSITSSVFHAVLKYNGFQFGKIRATQMTFLCLEPCLLLQGNNTLCHFCREHNFQGENIKDWVSHRILPAASNSFLLLPFFFWEKIFYYYSKLENFSLKTPQVLLTLLRRHFRLSASIRNNRNSDQ